jgi:predicted nucleic acid-binding protein
LNRYVIDSNILFGAIISNRRIYLEIIRNFDLYAPDFVLKETEKYEERLLQKTRLSRKDLNPFIVSLFKGITILPSFVIDRDAKQNAFELCKDIDEKDTPFVALSIELSIPLLTNDKKLYNGLKKKAFTNIILFEDIVDRFYKKD